MGVYSKFFASIIGGFVGVLTSMGMPADWLTPELQDAFVVLVASAFVFLFPPNAAKE